MATDPHTNLDALTGRETAGYGTKYTRFFREVSQDYGNIPTTMLPAINTVAMTEQLHLPAGSAASWLYNADRERSEMGFAAPGQGG